MTRILALAALCALTACTTTQGQLSRVQPPQVVTKVVEVYRPLPTWATDPLPRPAPANGTVRAVVDSHGARGDVIDLANCHRRLLRKVQQGEAVQAQDCAP